MIFPNIIKYLDRTFKEDQDETFLITKSAIPKRLTKMLTDIMHKRMH